MFLPAGVGMARSVPLPSTKTGALSPSVTVIATPMESVPPLQRQGHRPNRCSFFHSRGVRAFSTVQ